MKYLIFGLGLVFSVCRLVAQPVDAVLLYVEVGDSDRLDPDKDAKTEAALRGTVANLNAGAKGDYPDLPASYAYSFQTANSIDAAIDYAKTHVDEQVTIIVHAGVYVDPNTQITTVKLVDGSHNIWGQQLPVPASYFEQQLSNLTGLKQQPMAFYCGMDPLKYGAAYKVDVDPKGKVSNNAIGRVIAARNMGTYKDTQKVSSLEDIYEELFASLNGGESSAYSDAGTSGGEERTFYYDGEWYFDIVPVGTDTSHADGDPYGEDDRRWYTPPEDSPYYDPYRDGWWDS